MRFYVDYILGIQNFCHPENLLKNLYSPKDVSVVALNMTFVSL